MITSIFIITYNVRVLSFQNWFSTTTEFWLVILRFILVQLVLSIHSITLCYLNSPD